MDTPAERLKWARQRAGYSNATEAAAAFGFTYSNYSGHENGARNPSKANAQRYARALRVRWEWLLLGLGEPIETEGTPTVTRVPIISWIKAGPLCHADAILEREALAHVNVADLPDGNWAAFQVDGDSMDRVAPPDSIVIVNRADKILRAERFYIVSNDRNETTFKRYRAQPDRLQPFSTNPDHETIMLNGTEQVFGRVRKVIIDVR